MDLVAIGGRIKAERKFSNISQEMLAEIINVSPHYIYEIERGMKAMSLETLINVSKALKLSTDYILFGNRQESDALEDRLDELDSERRLRVECAFKAILPYIK